MLRASCILLLSLHLVGVVLAQEYAGTGELPANSFFRGPPIALGTSFDLVPRSTQTKNCASTTGQPLQIAAGRGVGLQLASMGSGNTGTAEGIGDYLGLNFLPTTPDQLVNSTPLAILRNIQPETFFFVLKVVRDDGVWELPKLEFSTEAIAQEVPPKLGKQQWIEELCGHFVASRYRLQAMDAWIFAVPAETFKESRLLDAALSFGSFEQASLALGDDYTSPEYNGSYAPRGIEWPSPEFWKSLVAAGPFEVQEVRSTTSGSNWTASEVQTVDDIHQLSGLAMEEGARWIAEEAKSIPMRVHLDSLSSILPPYLKDSEEPNDELSNYLASKYAGTASETLAADGLASYLNRLLPTRPDQSELLGQLTTTNESERAQLTERWAQDLTDRQESLWPNVTWPDHLPVRGDIEESNLEARRVAAVWRGFCSPELSGAQRTQTSGLLSSGQNFAKAAVELLKSSARCGFGIPINTEQNWLIEQLIKPRVLSGEIVTQPDGPAGMAWSGNIYSFPFHPPVASLASDSLYAFALDLPPDDPNAMEVVFTGVDGQEGRLPVQILSSEDHIFGALVGCIGIDTFTDGPVRVHYHSMGRELNVPIWPAILRLDMHSMHVVTDPDEVSRDSLPGWAVEQLQRGALPFSGQTCFPEPGFGQP